MVGLDVLPDPTIVVIALKEHKARILTSGLASYFLHPTLTRVVCL